MKKDKNKELNTIVLSGLLHDIGKFMQRAGFYGYQEENKEPSKELLDKYRYYHPIYTKRFINHIFKEEGNDLSEMAASHHSPKDYYSKILQVSDWLSSAERFTEEDYKKFVGLSDEEFKETVSAPEKTPLLSIFSLINPSENEQKYFKIVEDLVKDEKSTRILENFKAFPKAEASPNKGLYQELWNGIKGFNKIAEAIRDVNNDNILWNITTWYYLLMRYTSFIPAATPFDTDHLYLPDISLFNHSRITAAIAAVIYLNNVDEEELNKIIDALKDNNKERLNQEDQEYFILLGGDISGIQKFIYRITSKGAAKGLKGRSIYLKFLAKAIVHYILNRLDLPITQVIYQGGGRFDLLLPAFDYRINSRLDDKLLEKISKEIEEKMFEIHKGELGVVLGWDTFTPYNLLKGNFSEVMGNKGLGGAISKSKQAKFKYFIEKNYEDFFTNLDKGGKIKLCESCKAELPPDSNETKCEWCKSFEKLGNDIVSHNYFVETDKKPDDEWSKRLYKAFNIGYKFVENIDEAKDGILYGIFPEQSVIDKIYEDIKEGTVLGNLGFAYEFIGRAAPRKKGKEIKNFNELTDGSEGIKRLGILRMDVDNLGDTFGKKIRNISTLSRVSQLSHFIARFFTEWISGYISSKKEENKKEENKKYNDNLYMIYSGGDDLFIVGAWDKVVEIAGDIKKQFGAYTGDTLTISGGVALVPPKFPLYKGAEITGEMEDESKDYKRDKDERKKDALTFLGFTFGWEYYPEIDKFRRLLYNLIKEGKNGKNLPKAVITKIKSAYILRDSDEKELMKLSKDGGTKEDIEKLVDYQQWRWRLIYSLRRYKEFKEEMDEFIRFSTDERYANLFALPARWTELLTK